MSRAGHDLIERVATLDALFNISELSERSITKRDVAEYYRQSSIGYRLVHSLDGAIHMALSATGQFDRQGYREQARIVEQRLVAGECRTALELGCGRGYNLEQLTRRLPAMEFVGIDLTPSHVSAAKRRLRKFGRVRVQHADFEAMPFADGQFDAIYAVESFCHAVDLLAALNEAARVVSSGGLLILIDAWPWQQHDSEPDHQRALNIIQKSMAVAQAIPIREWLDMAEQAGWRLVECKGYNAEVMPNMERFERLATALITRRRLALTAARLAPKHLMNNVIAGYLIAQSMRQQCYVYGLLVLRRI